MAQLSAKETQPSYWVAAQGLGIPLCWALAFPRGWGVWGIWLGLLTTLTLQGAAMSAVVLRLDWEAEVQRAAARIQQGAAMEATEPLLAQEEA